MRLEYVEETGKGINTIVRKYGTEVFDFSNNFLQVNLPFNEKAMVSDNVSNDVPINGTVKEVLEQIKNNESITVEKLIIVIGKSRRTILRCIDKLKKLGIIKRVGSDKSGHWEIVE